MKSQWNIDKLMLWRSNSWTKYDTNVSGKTSLRVYYDQLLLISGTKILESFNMNSKTKGVYKGDLLILFVGSADLRIRKLRFQIKSDVAQCLSRLGEHFPVMSHSSLQSKNTISTKYRQLNEIFKHALNLNNDRESATSNPLPCDYENFIKLCLLDPTFPQVVSDTMRILQDTYLLK